MNKYIHLKNKWESIIHKIEQNNGTVHPLDIQPTATTEEIELIEKKLGYQLPKSFKETLMKFSISVNFMWFFSNDTILPKELHLKIDRFLI